MGLFGKKKSKEPDLQETVTQADVERLVAGLGRKDVRQAASSGLRPINSDPRVVAALIAALKDDDDDVRTAATTILATSRNPRVVEPLIAALEDGGEGVRLGAAIAVGTVVASTPGGDPRSLAALKSAFDAEEDPSMKDALKIVVATAEEAPSTPGDDPYAPWGGSVGENPVARDAWLRIATAISSREPGSTPT